MIFTLSVLILRENYGLLLWQNVLLAKLVNEGKKKKNRKDILLGELVNECKNGKKNCNTKGTKTAKKSTRPVLLSYYSFCRTVFFLIVDLCLASSRSVLNRAHTSATSSPYPGQAEKFLRTGAVKSLA